MFIIHMLVPFFIPSEGMLELHNWVSSCRDSATTLPTQDSIECWRYKKAQVVYKIQMEGINMMQM